jgi:hypothetical protein
MRPPLNPGVLYFAFRTGIPDCATDYKHGREISGIIMYEVFRLLAKEIGQQAKFLSLLICFFSF